MEASEAQVINFLVAALSSCGLLILWFDTNFLIDYLKLFRLTRFTYIEEYEKELFDNPDIKFFDFVLIKEPNFLNKLLACPLCLGFWLSAFCCILATKSILLIFSCYPLTLFLYYIFKRCQKNF
ncbi:hypothetical protein CMI37_19230 [Candidatus Pacearchaeota archaeon]|nr:hypothetical protein [Candidatus Pacearchaeota archaeon]